MIFILIQMKIKELNKQGVRPEDLEPVELVSSKPKEEVPEFVELVGQISLKSLDRAAQRKRQQQRPQQGPKQGSQQPPQQPQPRNQGPRGPRDRNNQPGNRRDNPPRKQD